MPAVAWATVLAACATGQSAHQDFSHADIANVANVKSGFGSQFQVTSVGPTGIDPRLLGAQPLPPGMTFEPADCATFASQQVMPAGVKGNMAATTAEGVNETGFIPTTDLPSTGTLFWRATAVDAANNIMSPPSAVQSFTPIPFSRPVE